MPTLNFAVLEELRDFMEEDVFTLIDEFEIDTQERLSLVEKAIQDQDAETLRTMAHTMKGGAASLGAENLSQHFRGLELRGRDASFCDIQQDFSNTQRSFAEAMLSIRRWLEGVK
ncbi:Hpt domain-containing protein [Zhongshania aquimaris]|uniref:Hpt domain-containing protein n=1 Tax=Zhongshania aquimaris TaxID=2857107 RepID=A0ABS6VM47_9GAMM|nr:Hpt domain-containing protein [Zhongshania aquimaris]MBW2939376.1 Hpt domain-containing protein [Zhongshania aquimaris]